MTEMNAAEFSGGRQLTSAMFRKPQAASALSLPGVKKFSQRLPEAVASALTIFGDLPPRIAIEDIGEDAAADALEHVSTATQDYVTGVLGVMASCDRTMAFAVADLAFGGTGDEPPFITVERPLSATEAGLVKLLLHRLLEDLPLIVATSFDLTVSSASGPPGSDSPAGEQAQPLVVFRLLVNVLGYDGEVKIGLNREQLLHLASGRVDGKSASTGGAPVDTISGGVAASSTDLLVTLGDETLTVEALMALAPGQLLSLRSTVHAPVQVWSGGIRLFPARLMRTGNHLAVRIGE